MTQRLKTCAALAEDPNPVPNTRDGQLSLQHQEIQRPLYSVGTGTYVCT